MVVSAGLDCGADQRALRLIIRTQAPEGVPPGATELRRSKKGNIGQLRLARNPGCTHDVGRRNLAYGRVCSQSVIEAIRLSPPATCRRQPGRFHPGQGRPCLVLPESDKTSTNTWHAQLRDL